MIDRTPEQVDAEIGALKARICRLRIERKASELFKAEVTLLRRAGCTCDEPEQGCPMGAAQLATGGTG